MEAKEKEDGEGRVEGRWEKARKKEARNKKLTG